MELVNCMITQNFDFLLKLVLIGDAAVGKTAMLMKYTDGVFEDGYICTIGVDFKLKDLAVNGKHLKLQIWDTAGQERFKPIANCYFRGSHGCIVAFDICDRQTFSHIASWVKQYREHSPETCVIIIGNKLDKARERTVKKKEAERVARDLECEYFETSAKTGENLQLLFDRLAGLIIADFKGERGPGVFLAPPAKKWSCCST